MRADEGQSSGCAYKTLGAAVDTVGTWCLRVRECPGQPMAIVDPWLSIRDDVGIHGIGADIARQTIDGRDYRDRNLSHVRIDSVDVKTKVKATLIKCHRGYCIQKTGQTRRGETNADGPDRKHGAAGGPSDPTRLNTNNRLGGA